MASGVSRRWPRRRRGPQSRQNGFRSQRADRRECRVRSRDELLPQPPRDERALEAIQGNFAELREREQRLEQLARALEAALHERAELEARLRERERRLDEHESELDTARADLDPARHPADAAPLAEDECPDDFLAVVERAKSHLAKRRTQLRAREEQLRRHAGRIQD